MTTIETVEQLKAAMPGVLTGVKDFLGQITIEAHKDDLHKIFIFLMGGIDPGFEVLMDLTAVDYLYPDHHTKIIYILHNPTNYDRLIVTTTIKRDEPIASVTGIWEGADWYERELYDMFGVHFEGHPDMKRILMPDDWEGHPLRRDYALTEVPVQFKHGVKPKIPSQIIPHVQCKTKNQ